MSDVDSSLLAMKAYGSLGLFKPIWRIKVFEIKISSSHSLAQLARAFKSD